MNDEQIVDLYWQRDETAVQLTSDKYEAYLTKVAHNILADLEDCRECVNDTYLRAWNSMPTNRPKVLSTFLGKITRNISIDLFRRKNSKYSVCHLSYLPLYVHLNYLLLTVRDYAVD